MRDRRRVSLVALLVLAAALAVVAAGCGGGDESSADDSAIETTTETDATETDETTEETTETEDTDVGAIANEDCLQLASIGAKFSEALGATGSQQNLETTSDFFDELVSAAPDEIKDDLATLADAWGEIAEALKDVDLTSANPSPETIAKLQELGQKFSTPELQQASQNIEAWAKENCGTS